MNIATIGEIRRDLENNYKIPSWLSYNQAVKIKKANQLTAGVCGICGRYEERLVPVELGLCKRCVEKRLLERLPIRFRIAKNYLHPRECDVCGRLTPKLYFVNPYICSHCISKFSKQFSNTFKY